MKKVVQRLHQRVLNQVFGHKDHSRFHPGSYWIFWLQLLFNLHCFTLFTTWMIRVLFHSIRRGIFYIIIFTSLYYRQLIPKFLSSWSFWFQLLFSTYPCTTSHFYTWMIGVWFHTTEFPALLNIIGEN